MGGESGMGSVEKEGWGALRRERERGKEQRSESYIYRSRFDQRPICSRKTSSWNWTKVTCARSANPPGQSPKLF